MKLLKFIGKLLTFILAIIYFWLLLSLITVNLTKSYIRSDNFLSFITDMDILSLKVSSINEKDYNSNATIRSSIVSDLKAKGIPEEITTEILDNPELNNLLASYISEYFDHVVAYKPIPEVTEKDINRVISIEKVEESLNKELSITQEQQLNMFIKSTVQAANQQINKIDSQVMSNDEVVTGLRFLFSNEYIYVLVTIMLFIFALTFLLSWSIKQPFIIFGIASLIAVLTTIITYCLIYSSIVFFINNKENFVFNIANSLQVLKNSFLLYIILIGVLMIIIYLLLNKFINKQQLDIQTEEVSKKLK